MRFVVAAVGALAWCFTGTFAGILVDFIEAAAAAQFGIDLALVDVLVGAFHFLLIYIAALAVARLIMLMGQACLVFRLWMAVFSGAQKAGHKILTCMVCETVRHTSGKEVPLVTN